MASRSSGGECVSADSPVAFASVTCSVGADSAGPLVDLDLNAVRADGPHLGQVELEAVDPVREETFAATEDRREDHQPELVDEVVLEQRADERAASVDEDRAVGLLLELLQPADDVAGDNRRVLPLRILERVRDDVL